MPLATPQRRPSVQCEQVQETGECVLLLAEEGRVLALNALGAAVWELLDGSRQASDLAAIVAAATGANRAQVETDVGTLLERLAAERFLA